nr:hypothetical protein CFP56_65633 [Quercus suber]
MDSLDDVMSLESLHTGPSRDVLRKDSSSSESSEFSSDEWEVNKHCSSLSDQRLAKLRFDFQIPFNVPTRIAEIGKKCYSYDGEGVGLYEASFISW